MSTKKNSTFVALLILPRNRSCSHFILPRTIYKTFIVTESKRRKMYTEKAEENKLLMSAKGHSPNEAMQVYINKWKCIKISP